MRIEPALERLPLRRRLVPLLALLLLAGGVTFLVVQISLSEERSGGEVVELTGRQEVAQLYRGIEQSGPRLGAADASVELDVFNDVQCGPCARWHVRTIPVLVRRDVGRGAVRLRLRHYPTSRRERTLGGIASAAAALQDAEWQYAELLMRNLEALGGRIDEGLLSNVARAVDVDVRRWQRDQESEDVEARLADDDELGIDLRLPAEPAVTVTGPEGSETLVESPSLADIEAAIERVS